MRAALVTVLLLLAIAAAVLITWSMGRGEGLMPGSLPGAAPPEVADEGGTSALPEGVVATRAAAPAPNALPTADIADRPTAWLRIIDHDTEQPIAGAIVRRVQDAADLAFSDERGLAALPLADVAQLAVVVDGHLLRLVPTQLGSTEAEPQLVRMVRDDRSVCRQFEFVGPGGEAVAAAFVRLRPLAESGAGQSSTPAVDAVRQRAWTEHTMLAALPVSSDVAVQIGRYNEDRVHRLSTNGTVRFVVPGDFELEAATTTGLVGGALVHVAVDTRSAPQRVQLVAGAFVSGTVADLGGQPLLGAEVVIEGGEPLGLVATSDAAGRFTIGPLAAGAVTLLVSHVLHQPISEGPVQAPASDIAIRLRALAKGTLRGRVRSRPQLTPIVGATVVWQVARGEAASTKTAADGTFELQTIGDLAARLLVQATNHITYTELVDPGAAFADYDLLPADTATRLAAGLTATLEGVVLDAGGLPAASVSVRWWPAQPTLPDPSTIRRSLEGATLELPLVATTGEDGAFVLETTQFGAGRLAMVQDASNAVEVVATPGRTVNGLRLQP